MSADNGYILRKHENKYVLQMYFDSADELPPVEDAREEEKFDTLEEALERFQWFQTQFVIEYGLTVRINDRWSVQ